MHEVTIYIPSGERPSFHTEAVNYSSETNRIRFMDANSGEWHTTSLPHWVRDVKPDYWFIGDSTDVVLAIQGAPDRVNRGGNNNVGDTVMHWGDSFVCFDSNGRVISYEMKDRPLKVKAIQNRCSR